MNDSDLIKMISNGFESAKAGNAVKVYEHVAPFHDNGSMPIKSHYPFGWIIYYALHQSHDGNINTRKRMLARYLKLQVKVPHKLHSMILTEAIHLYKDSKDAVYNNKSDKSVRFSIVNFFKLWNQDNLRPGDWNRKSLDDKPLSSTVKKLLTLCVDELEETRILPSPNFIALIDKAVDTYPDSFNLLSQRAALHILANETAKAAELLRKALLLAPGKFYLWSKLAATVSPAENPHLHVAILYRALNAPGPEQFKGKIRLSIAETLASRGAFPQSLWELQQVKSIYESNGWHLPAKYNAVMQRIPNDTIADNPEHIYRKVAHLADEEVYSGLPTVVMTKTYHKKPDPTKTGSGFNKPVTAWRLTDSNGNNLWIQPHRFRINPDLPTGTRVNVSIFSGKVVKAEISD